MAARAQMEQVKLEEFNLKGKSDKKNPDFRKSKICTNHLNQNIFGWGYFFEGYKFGGVKFFNYENVSICNAYRVSDIFRIVDKILNVG